MKQNLVSQLIDILAELDRGAHIEERRDGDELVIDGYFSWEELEGMLNRFVKDNAYGGR